MKEYTACNMELYLEGFRSMTLSRTLWLIILSEIIQYVLHLKIFFFPDFLGDHLQMPTKGTYVGNEAIQRALPEKATDFNS